MTYQLLPRARRELRAYVLHVAGAADTETAARENARIRAALETFAASHADGRVAEIPGWPRPLRRHYVHPFHVFYERRAQVLLVFRLYHHARRPIGA